MKKLFFLIAIIISIVLNTNAQDGLDESKALGFISYLNTIKELSENKILWSEAKFNQRKTERLELIKSAKTPDEKNELMSKQKSDDDNRQLIQNKYASLRWQINLLINQYSADLVERNSVSLYRNMNEYLSGEEELKSRLTKFKPILTKIDEIYLELIYFKYDTGGPQSMAGLQEIFTLAGINPYEIYKDIKASKKEKIATLVGYIKEMRLKQLSELIKPIKPEEDKDKK